MGGVRDGHAAFGIRGGTLLVMAGARVAFTTLLLYFLFTIFFYMQFVDPPLLRRISPERNPPHSLISLARRHAADWPEATLPSVSSRASGDNLSVWFPRVPALGWCVLSLSRSANHGVGDCNARKHHDARLQIPTFDFWPP
jgi:hypothetical protein